MGEADHRHGRYATEMNVSSSVRIAHSSLKPYINVRGISVAIKIEKIQAAVQYFLFKYVILHLPPILFEQFPRVFLWCALIFLGGLMCVGFIWLIRRSSVYTKKDQYILDNHHYHHRLLFCCVILVLVIKKTFFPLVSMRFMNGISVLNGEKYTHKDHQLYALMTAILIQPNLKLAFNDIHIFC